MGIIKPFVSKQKKDSGKRVSKKKKGLLKKKNFFVALKKNAV